MAVVTDLDHIGVGVRDLALAARAYERLGFTLTPYARHAGAAEPGGPTVPRATGNRCAMLRHGYIELIAVVDPTLHSGGLDQRIAQREGGHIAAFGCTDTKAADAHLRAAGFASRGSLYLERMVDTPDGQALARFERVPVAPHETPEGIVFYINHLTRPVLWQPQLLSHANGAIGLAEMVFHVADVAEAAARYARFFGVAPEGTGGVRRLALPHGTLILADKDNLPGPGVAPAPAIAAITVTTASLAAVHRLLDAAEEEGAVDYRLSGDRLVVGPVATHGVHLSFAQI